MKNQGPRNCRHCNHRLEAEAERCPACKRSQSQILEYLALLFGISVLALVAYLQFYQPATPTEPPYATKHTQDSQSAKGLLEVYERDSPSLIQHRKVSILKTHPSTTTRYSGTKFLQQTGSYPFYVATKKWNPKRAVYEFYRTGMQGTEIQLRGDPRRYFISENQRDYPESESGCGPTALLNLFIWYSKFGLLEESIRHANPETYKQLKFKQIDRKILDIQKQSRTRNGGTNTLAAIVAMDELVQQYSGNKNARLHFEVKQAPLRQSDFTALSRNYRVGILSVRPKDKQTGQLLGNHAVLCIRGDTSGMITLANWGEFSHGRLVDRPDGQWFIPSDATQHELRINNLTTLIPFVSKS